MKGDCRRRGVLRGDAPEAPASSSSSAAGGYVFVSVRFPVSVNVREVYLTYPVGK
jgi:hypothetical protein